MPQVFATMSFRGPELKTKPYFSRILSVSLSYFCRLAVAELFLSVLGYHQVKADRSLPVYHRQRSKPERDSEKRHWTGRRKSADPSTSGHVRGGWPVQNSHPSLKTETEYDVRSADLSGEEQSKYQSEMDVLTIHRLAEMANNDPKAENNQSIMFRLLRSQENLPNSSQSRVSNIFAW